MKRIFDRLGLQPDRRLEDFYFKKDDEGQDVFYPWGAPGENYHINRNQKDGLRVLMYCGLLALLLSMAATFLYFELSYEGQYRFNWIVVTVITAFFLSYCIFVYIFTRNLEPGTQKAPVDIKGGKNIPKNLTLLMILKIAIIFVGILYNPHDNVLRMFGLSIVAIYPILIWFVWRRQGYIFQKKPPSGPA